MHDSEVQPTENSSNGFPEARETGEDAELEAKVERVYKYADDFS